MSLARADAGSSDADASATAATDDTSEAPAVGVPVVLFRLKADCSTDAERGIFIFILVESAAQG